MSEADQRYVDSGILVPDEIAKSRFGSEEYSLETVIDIESREIPGPENPED